MHQWPSSSADCNLTLQSGAGADASVIIYSLAKIAKANNLKPYDYEHLLTEIPKHMDDRDTSFCEDLLPWSEKLPANCKK